MEIVNWLKANKEVLSFRAIEKQLGIPDTTLNKVVNGRSLPKKWVEPLTDFKNKLTENTNQPTTVNHSEIPTS